MEIENFVCISKYQTMTDFEQFDKALAKFESGSHDESPKDKAGTGCQHLNTVDEGGVVACTDCGQEIERATDDKEWRYYGPSDTKRSADPNRVQKRKVDEKSIFKDVENMGFSDKMITAGNKIYLESTRGSILRGTSRKSVIFASMFYSYKQDGKPQVHDKLLSVFGLTRKVALAGMNYVNRHSPRDAMFRGVYITPLHLVGEIMDRFSATEVQKQQVESLYNQIEHTSSKLLGSRPQSVAASLVYYYIESKKINISLKQFSEKVNLSDLTILKLSKEISTVLNTPEIL